MKPAHYFLTILTLFAPACDAAVDVDATDRDAIVADMDHGDGEHAAPDQGQVNWDDLQHIDLDGSAYHDECGEHLPGDSWVEPGCFACFCDEEGEASCYFAVCLPPEPELGHTNLDDFVEP